MVREAGQAVGRPYVLLSAAMSADGYLDDASDRRLVLSGPSDLDQVDALRADSDAILVGARTVRKDNPGLRVRSPARRAERERAGRPPSPARVTLTQGGELDPAARFFAGDDGTDRLVYAPAGVAGAVREQLGVAAVVVAGGDRLDLAWVLADLAGRGVGRLMVEGGAEVLGQFLAQGLADELRLAVAPVFVADPAAPRLVAPPSGEGMPAGEGVPAGWPRALRLAEVGQAGRMAVLRYRLIAPFAPETA